MTKQFLNKKCIIRTYSAGVWFGTVKELENSECVLLNARRLWYWDGANSLSQLAVDGSTKGDKCKFSMAINEDCGIYLPQVIEVLPCSEKSIINIENVKEWKL